MSLQDWTIGGILIVAVLIGSMLAPAITESQFFKSFPEFDVYYTSDIINTTQTEYITIKNIGKIQAKDVNVVIQSNDKIFLNQIDCPETDSDFKDGKILLFEFPKFSTNIDCLLKFESSSDKNIHRITVSSNDAPGYEHKFTKDDDDDNILITIINYIPWQYGLVIFGIVTYLVVALTLSYFVVRIKRRKKQQQVSEKRLLEIQNNVENLTKERKLLEESSRNYKPHEIPKHWVERLDWIENELIKLSLEKDQVKVIVSTEMNLHNLIGKFFTDWTLLEQQMFTLVSKVKGVELRRFQIMDALSIIQQNNMMTREQIFDFQKIRIFRNELGHGLIQPSKKDLEEMNFKLESLLSVINDIGKNTSQTKNE